jgi:hypothetical protein
LPATGPAEAPRGKDRARCQSVRRGVGKPHRGPAKRLALHTGRFAHTRERRCLGHPIVHLLPCLKILGSGERASREEERLASESARGAQQGDSQGRGVPAPLSVPSFFGQRLPATRACVAVDRYAMHWRAQMAGGGRAPAAAARVLPGSGTRAAGGPLSAGPEPGRPWAIPPTRRAASQAQAPRRRRGSLCGLCPSSYRCANNELTR